MISLLFVAATTVAASASAAASSAPTASVTSPPALPVGHPHVDRGASPHGPQGPSRFFQPPPDTTEEEAALSPGTIIVELRDASNNVLPHRAVELGSVQQSVAKGDTHKHVSATTGDDGRAAFDGLDRASNIAYRVTVHDGDATFAARPFQLNHEHGTHVVLHVYPVTSDFREGALIFSRGVMLIEMKDDRVQIQQRIDVFNGSPVAWVPHDVILKLPEDFTALNGMQQMSDIGVDAVPKEGARIHGTFGPGENAILFSWQLPYAGTPEVAFDLGMPPNLALLMVRAAASPGMKLVVPGFREAVSQVNEEGQRELVTSKQVEDASAPLRKVHIDLTDLPTPGPTRWVATGLAFLFVAAGLTAVRKHAAPDKSAGKRDRTRVLHALEELEDAHARGDVGPKTYERARRELIDELAASLAAKT